MRATSGRPMARTAITPRHLTTNRCATAAAASRRTFIQHTEGPATDLGVEVYPSEEGVASYLVRSVEEAAAKAIAERGVFLLAVPGGSVLKMLAGLSNSKKVDWSKVSMMRGIVLGKRGCTLGDAWVMVMTWPPAV